MSTSPSWTTPLLEPACAVVDVDAFIGEFGRCVVQEREGIGPRQFRLSRLSDFYARAREESPSWSLHHPQGRYVFHDNLAMGPDPGSVEVLDELFGRHPPTDWFIDMSERRPCVAIRLALGGPKSGTPSPHTHGSAQCLLLSGRKRWWLWPPPAAMMIEWIVRGARARNRLEFWQQHIVPIFEGRRGDVTDHVMRSLDDLARQGLFRPVELGQTTSHSFMAAHAWVQRARARGEGVIAEHYEPTTVVQNAGEVMFVPESWSHSVRNEGTWNLAVIYELCLCADAPSPDHREVS